MKNVNVELDYTFKIMNAINVRMKIVLVVLMMAIIAVYLTFYSLYMDHILLTKANSSI